MTIPWDRDNNHWMQLMKPVSYNFARGDTGRWLEAKKYTESWHRQWILDGYNGPQYFEYLVQARDRGLSSDHLLKDSGTEAIQSSPWWGCTWRAEDSIKDKTQLYLRTITFIIFEEITCSQCPSKKSSHPLD